MSTSEEGAAARPVREKVEESLLGRREIWA
jgi:hypothetical protein